MLAKLLFFPLLLLLSIMIAAIYGALHNQISYSVSPEYFHNFKFQQFGISDAFQNRLGAALVGVYASWWMGLVIGIPIGLIGLFLPNARSFQQNFIIVTAVTIVIIFVTGISGLLLSNLSQPPEDTIHYWTERLSLSNPEAFFRAGSMHNASYLGGVIGLFIGILIMIYAVFRRKNHQS